MTGEPCRTLAYPYGLYDERVVRAAGEAGYELAFGWLPGPWRPLEAPRLPAPPRHGARRLSLKLARRAAAGAVSVRFSVVIPTKGRPEPLRRTLESLWATRSAPDEVLVIDADEDASARELVARACRTTPCPSTTSTPAEPDQAAQHRHRPRGRRRRGLPRRRRLAADATCSPSWRRRTPIQQRGRGDRLDRRAASAERRRRAALAPAPRSLCPGAAEPGPLHPLRLPALRGAPATGRATSSSCRAAS